MRELNFEDTFAFSEILDKLDLQEDINALFDQATRKGTTEEQQAYLGGQFILKIAKRWHMAKDEILRFVASITSKSVEEAKQMKFIEIKGIFTELFKSEDIRAFISSAQNEQK